MLTPVQEIEFLGLTINSVTLEISLKKTKIQKVVSECQNLLNYPQTSILELIKLTGLVDHNYSSSLTRKAELSFPPNATNIFFNKRPFLFRQNGFELKRKNQTELVGIKLRTVQWPGVNSKLGEVLIQKYASAKD